MKQCKHCYRNTMSNDAGARAQGWRWYDGPTLGGGHLSDVVCPVCAGTATPEVASAEWRVGCNTCEWEFEPFDDSDDEKLLTGKAANSVADDHECEPDVWIRPPGTDRDYRTSDFDRDGNLRGERVKSLAGAR